MDQGLPDTVGLMQIWSHKTGTVYRRYPHVQDKKKSIAWRNDEDMSTHF